MRPWNCGGWTFVPSYTHNNQIKTHHWITGDLSHIDSSQGKLSISHLYTRSLTSQAVWQLTWCHRRPNHQCYMALNRPLPHYVDQKYLGRACNNHKGWMRPWPKSTTTMGPHEGWYMVVGPLCHPNWWKRICWALACRLQPGKVKNGPDHRLAK